MEILKLEMVHFGKFENQVLDFHPGINVICGDNETGKTTIHAFVRAMLYGLDRRSRGPGRPDEYSLRRPFSNPGWFEGKMTFKCGNSVYRLERCFDRENRSVRLIDQSEGRELPPEELQTLLGNVSEALFCSTVFITASDAFAGLDVKARFFEALKEYAKTQSGDEDRQEEVDVRAALSDLEKQAAKKKKERLGGLSTVEARIKEEQMQLDLLGRSGSRGLSFRDGEEDGGQPLRGRRAAERAGDDEDEWDDEEPARRRRSAAYEEDVEDEWEDEVPARRRRSAAYEEDVEDEWEDEEPARRRRNAAYEEDGEDEWDDEAPARYRRSAAYEEDGEDEWEDEESASPRRSAPAHDEEAGEEADDEWEDEAGTDEERLSDALAAAKVAKVSGVIAVLAVFAGILSGICAWLSVRMVPGILLAVSAVLLLGAGIGEAVYSIHQRAVSAMIMRELRKKRKNAALPDKEAEKKKAFKIRRLVEKDKADTAREEMNRIRQTLEVLEEKADSLREPDDEERALLIAVSHIKALTGRREQSLTGDLGSRASAFISRITRGKYQRVSIDESQNIFVSTARELLRIEQVSDVTRSQIWFCLRMAAAERMGNEPLPILLDNTFALYDTPRLKRTLEWLRSSRYQVILFSGSDREKEILKEITAYYA